jgi:hypothetical protein
LKARPARAENPPLRYGENREDGMEFRHRVALIALVAVAPAAAPDLGHRRG